MASSPKKKASSKSSSTKKSAPGKKDATAKKSPQTPAQKRPPSQGGSAKQGAKKKQEKPAAKKPAKGKKPAQKKTRKRSAKKTRSAGEGLSALEELLARLRSIAELPENQNCVWLVELVIPPGSFMARRLPEPVDHAALNAEIEASTEALRWGKDLDRHRFLITTTSTGGIARQYAKAMSELIPNPTVPMPNDDLFSIDAVLHAQFLGDEDY